MKRFSILPLACFALMLAYAGYGAAVVGHWPHYAHPDPKQLPLPALFDAVAFVALLGGMSVLLVPIGYGTWRLVLRRKRRTAPAHGTWMALYAAGAMIWILEFTALHRRLPWHAVLDWILD